MEPFLVVPSTTSHKHEALVPTLDLFARLGDRVLHLGPDRDRNLMEELELAEVRDPADATFVQIGRAHV